MTFRYLIALGDAGRLSGINHRIPHVRDLSGIKVSPNCLAWIGEGATFHRLGENSGFILGTLFYRYGDSVPVQLLESGAAAAIVKSRGAHLIDRFWGNYLAVLPTPTGHIVLRDPAGTLPCNYTVASDRLIIGSDPELLVDAGFLKSEIDWFGLARSHFLPAFPCERTALENVWDLLPGMSLEMTNGKIATSLRWNPWDHVSFDPGAHLEENRELMKRTVQQCISGWSRAYARGLVGVSGGLDSSIVALGLKNAGNVLSCLTLNTKDPLGDERPYCRTLCQHLSAPLFEEGYSLEDVRLDRPSLARRPRPLGRLDAQAYDAAIARVARRAGSKAFFTGNGGDNVFYFSNSARALADRFLVEGVSSRLFTTVQDICRLTGASVRQVASSGWQALRTSKQEYSWETDSTFLATSIVDEQSADPPQHPWLSPPTTRVLPGKAAHIAMLLRMQHSLEAYTERSKIPVLHPLVSQPLIELCLQIPTWQQCADGRNRSVARQAFAEDLPTEIIFRRGKGSPQGFTYEIFTHFHAEIRERLLGGVLAQNGILDRGAVEAALLPNAHIREGSILRLLHLADTEAWIDYWRTKRSTDPSAPRRPE